MVLDKNSFINPNVIKPTRASRIKKLWIGIGGIGTISAVLSSCPATNPLGPEVGPAYCNILDFFRSATQWPPADPDRLADLYGEWSSIGYPGRLLQVFTNNSFTDSGRSSGVLKRHLGYDRLYLLDLNPGDRIHDRCWYRISYPQKIKLSWDLHLLQNIA
jgi:hypothetical protein